MTISQKHILVLSICAIETALLTLQLVTTGNIPWVNIREGSWIVVVIMLLPVVFTVLHSAWSFSWRFTALLMGVGGAVGFLFEEIGLTYGVVFGGQYSYPQHTLLIAQVPILVVLYWPLFIYLSYCLSNAVFRWFSGIDRFPTKAIPFLLIADGFIAVSIDLFLDPIQVQLGSWQWHANGWYYGIPIGNFVGW
ncbi:carotenoid biosynthesis protein, partial [Candidatus Uhrbacteria bacterium]|nr:carotenoid biosynthesis protein [Candidatus Uhrbacteria bacterium]